MIDRSSVLAELLANPSRVAHVAPDDAVALLTQLATLQVALLRAACGSAVEPRRDTERPTDDRMLEVNEAAAMLGLTPRWLYRHADDLPFTRRVSRKIVRFSRAGIVKWLGSRRT